MSRITPVYPEDIIGEVIQAMSAVVLDVIKANETEALGSTLIQQIRYSKSSFQELVTDLAQADGSGVERYNKYPLIHLVQDVTIERGGDVGLFGTAILNIIFLHQTVNTYKVSQRDAKVFKPVLWPMYYEFLYQLERSRWVFKSDTTTGQFPHRVIKHSFWGNRQLNAGAANVLNDYVDAIEIQNLPVKFNFTNCQ